ncbi:MAG: Maf family protein [Methylovirgula sp.]
MASTSLWCGDAPVLLASKSAIRRALLAAAGIPFESIAAEIDERRLEAPLREEGASAIAAHLARAKSLAVARTNPARLVIGADQTLALGDAIFAKPRELGAARAQLARLSGRSHTLYSALCVVRAEHVLFETVESATLTCRPFSADFIECYLAAVGEQALASVGTYQVEALGIQLFERIEGDHTTILGLPMLPLLAFLRREGSLAG